MYEMSSPKATGHMGISMRGKNMLIIHFKEAFLIDSKFNFGGG